MNTPPRLLGATVARLTPDQKVACSNHVGVISFVFLKSSLKWLYLQFSLISDMQSVYM